MEGLDFTITRVFRFSLRAVLLQVADHVARLLANWDASHASPAVNRPLPASPGVPSALSADLQSTQGEAVSGAGVASRAELEARLQTVFAQFVRLAADSRAEVRNSALKSLFATLAMHGPALSPPARAYTLNDVVCASLASSLSSARHAQVLPRLERLLGGQLDQEVGPLAFAFAVSACGLAGGRAGARQDQGQRSADDGALLARLRCEAVERHSPTGPARAGARVQNAAALAGAHPLC